MTIREPIIGANRYSASTDNISEYNSRVINAIAKALGRIEHADEWAGVDHDMPGTTEREREVSRWAAVRLLDELQHELRPLTKHFKSQGITPEVKAPRTNGKENGMLHAGPFKTLTESMPHAQRDKHGKIRLPIATDYRMDQVAEEKYHTRLYEPRYMTDEELEEAYTDRREQDHFYNYQ